MVCMNLHYCNLHISTTKFHSSFEKESVIPGKVLCVIHILIWKIIFITFSMLLFHVTTNFWQERARSWWSPYFVCLSFNEETTVEITQPRSPCFKLCLRINYWTFWKGTSSQFYSLEWTFALRSLLERITCYWRYVWNFHSQWQKSYLFYNTKICY